MLQFRRERDADKKAFRREETADPASFSIRMDRRETHRQPAPTFPCENSFATPVTNKRTKRDHASDIFSNFPAFFPAPGKIADRDHSPGLALHHSA
jgi:hypothetical protein